MYLNSASSGKSPAPSTTRKKPLASQPLARALAVYFTEIKCESAREWFLTVGTLRYDDTTATRTSKTTIGLAGKTTTLQVHLTYLYISLPFLRDYDVKIPNFVFYGERKQAMTKLYFAFWTRIWSLGIQIQEGFAYIWPSKYVGIIAFKTERTWSDVPVAVASLDLKVPSRDWQAARTTS